MYQLVKKILFNLDPERAHYFALNSLQLAHQFGLTKFFKKTFVHPLFVMNLSFPNRVGLSAGYDRNGDYVDALAALGFGFIEIGTVTPKPQVGNPTPRIFRLVAEEAIINRMGFANKGLEYVVKRLEKIQYQGVLGINIGKNKTTLNANASDDYVQCFRKLAKFASYIALNISSPNTEGLRDLQQRDTLTPFLAALKNEQKIFERSFHKYVPLVVKISPDMTAQELHELALVLLEQQIDGVIATNTTLTREGIEGSLYAKEQGGLSGRPLQARSTEMVQQLYSILGNKIPIIACGGIMDLASAQEKLTAGAKLIQIYTGLIYHGPGLVRRLVVI